MMNKAELGRIYGKNIRMESVSAHVQVLYEDAAYMQDGRTPHTGHLQHWSQAFYFFFLQGASYQDDADPWLQVHLDSMSGHPPSAHK